MTNEERYRRLPTKQELYERRLEKWRVNGGGTWNNEPRPLIDDPEPPTPWGWIKGGIMIIGFGAFLIALAVLAPLTVPLLFAVGAAKAILEARP